MGLNYEVEEELSRMMIYYLINVQKDWQLYGV